MKLMKNTAYISTKRLQLILDVNRNYKFILNVLSRSISDNFQNNTIIYINPVDSIAVCRKKSIFNSLNAKLLALNMHI